MLAESCHVCMFNLSLVKACLLARWPKARSVRGEASSLHAQFRVGVRSHAATVCIFLIHFLFYVSQLKSYMHKFASVVCMCIYNLFL